MNGDDILLRHASHVVEAVNVLCEDRIQLSFVHQNFCEEVRNGRLQLVFNYHRSSHFKVRKLIPLEELNLSVRAYNCLKRAQVNSVSDLMGFSYEDLLEIKNFGSKSADEVIEALERIGISIPQSRTSA